MLISGVRWLVVPFFLFLVACEREELPEGEERTVAAFVARTQGMVYLQQDRLDEADAEFQRLASLAPDDATGPANLALVALRRGDLRDAERLAKLAIEREPDDPWAHLILAKALELQGRDDEALRERERALTLDSTNVRALWTLAGGASEEGDPSGNPRRAEFLARLVQRAPANLPARLELAEEWLRVNEPDSAAAQLEQLESLIPTFTGEAAVAFDRALSRARAGDAEAARTPARRFHDLMRLTPTYQAGREVILGPKGAAIGFPTVSFSHELSLDVPDPAVVLEALRFADATDLSGLEIVAVDNPVFAVGDFDGDRDQDIYAWGAVTGGTGRGYLLRNDLGRFIDVTPDGLRQVAAVHAATWADHDGDGLMDLYVVREGPNRLYRNLGDGRFEDRTEQAGVADPGEGRTATFADLDHDGDLDLFVASRGTNRLYRNAGDGTFTSVTGAMGLNDGEGSIRQVRFADFDNDGDLDLVAARGAAGLALFANLRQDRFLDLADSAGLGNVGSADAVALGDYDNDGLPDLLVAAADRHPALYRNQGDGRFEHDRRSESILSVAARAEADAAFLDFDNDGHLDLFVGLHLFRNDGSGAFADRSDLLPADRLSARSVAVFDYNEDGDLDVLTGAATGLRFLRNDGGNANHHLELRLLARGAGSGKVNRFGVGSKVEALAGDLYQSRTVQGPMTLFGLGHRLKADVVRIVWTNGVPQYFYYPGTDQDLLETQQLKGSCAFVYAWNGEGYEFVTDAMWRSAIGMPLGIMARRTATSGRIYAPPAASREYLRISGDHLRPHDGRYRLQLTEELWEVAYVDEVKLLAVEHPDSVEIFVDERFVPPAPPELRLFRVGQRIPPASATDAEGNDLLPILRTKDARYVSDLRPGPFQGIVAPHAVVLELPAEAAAAERPFLFLQGWIFPTDASINVAVSQSSTVQVMPPQLEVPDGTGGWRTAIPDMGFPSGKDKTVVVDLGGVVRPEDPRIRIRTNMQIYWDHAFFAVGAIAGPAVAGGAEAAAARMQPSHGGGELRLRLLRPQTAHLHFRGFSREYRKGGRHGPHWFDYENVSTESPWLPIAGRYTRYGDVGPLLREPDDMYVVMAPGDEMTVEFDAAGASDLPNGWTRTFLLYTDGWIKDADLNTATGNRVEPLPFHAQSRYPYGPKEAYPRDSTHRRYLEQYQTREVSGTDLGLSSREPEPRDRRR